MSQDTKQRIIEAGAQIIHHKGYNHTGIQEVLTAAAVPKGSFYFYFKSKEDFGLTVIDYFNDLYVQMLSPIVEMKDLSPLKRIEKIFDYFIDFFKEINYTRGCPIGNLSQEMGDLSDAFSNKLSVSVELISGVYKDLLDEAKKTNLISHRIDSQKTAEFIVSSWHGSLVKMKIDKSIAPLELHKQFVFNLLEN